MKTTTKLASYLLSTAVMAVSPFTAFATESAGTNGMTFYDYLASNADKDTVIDFNQAPTTGNEVDSSSGMDVPISDIGGLYMLQDTKDDEKPMYFYRGNVTDNNVIFNDFCWLIVRTTETGGTKLLYNGTPTDDGQCLGDPDWTTEDTINAMNAMYSADPPVMQSWPTTNIGAVQFNTQYNSPSDFGYMYGERYESTSKSFTSTTVFGNDVSYSNGTYTLQDTTTGFANTSNAHHYTCLTTSTTCSEVYYEVYRWSASGSNGYFLTFTDGDTLDTALEKMAKNEHDSTIKTAVESWYEENMTGVTDYLEDTIFYGSKTFASGALSTKDSNFGSNFDAHGYSYTDTMLDIYYHGASREADSNLQEPTMNAVNFDYTDPNGIYTVANGKLKYPVGLLTNSEMILAGNGYPAMAKNTYIDDNFLWWGLSPVVFGDRGAVAGFFYGLFGGSVSGSVYDGIGVRPSVSLKSTLGALDGDGSRENPFTGLTESSSSDDPADDQPTDEPDTPESTTPDNPQTADMLVATAVSASFLLALGYLGLRKTARR